MQPLLIQCHLVKTLTLEYLLNTQVLKPVLGYFLCKKT